jgi:DNA polymerase-3 subunit epsilon
MYLFFDTETTGRPKDYKAPISDVDNWPRLVQLGYLIYDETGDQLSQGEFIVRPDGFLIPEEASNIHGITNEIANSRGLRSD